MVGARIAARRIELGMSQDELARRLGYKSRSTVQKIEAGINDITQSKVVKFAEALDTTPAYIMGWDEEKPATTEGDRLSELQNKIMQEVQSAPEDLQKEFLNYLLFSKAQREK